ncbi:MAG: sulfatase [Myxococcales bacterium]|nr:sulfatase [Myxococcales bacterium]MCB9580883.1 sulfatase [Polyangiaceae bacterium]
MHRRHLSLILGLAAGCMAVATGCNDKPKPAGAASSATPSAAAPVAVAPSGSAAGGSAADQPKRPEKMNVLMLTIDSLRADMPWTGYDKEIAPNLSKLVKESTVYTHAYSTAPYTAQSVASWLSGRYASTLYRQGWFFTGYSKANHFFPEALQDAGIRTIGWQAHLYFGRGKGLDQGFDVWEMAPGIVFDPNTDRDITSDKMEALGKELLGKSENTGKQFFAWAHFMDPHDQYNKHPGVPDFGNNNRGRYDNEVYFTDEHIGSLLSWAEKQPWWKNTALIITGDHGEAFGDHDMWKHAFEVWEVLLRVPLIIKVPGAKPQRIEERRSLIDLAPTIMDLMGQKPLDSFMGQSLVPEVVGEKKPEKRDVIVAELAEDSHNPPRRTVIKGDYKLIVFGTGWKYLLYDIKNDPHEDKDLAKEQPEKLEEMKKVLADAFAKIPSVEPYGGMKLKGGKVANGPMGPPAEKKPAEDKK